MSGKIVVLHFWTASCINCVRVIDELRPIEQRFLDEVVVIGVHSPKFPHEHEHDAVERAVARLRLTHPALDDPDLTTWQQYGIRGWPTVVVIDPDGYVVGGVSGEGCGDVVVETVQQLIASHDATGTLDRRRAVALASPLADRVTLRPLSFPGKVAASADGRALAIADTGHNRVVVCDVEGRVWREHGGLSSPQGVRFDNDDVIVCDTGADRVVRLIEGRDAEVLASGISSPWDVLVEGGGTYLVTEAGRHRLWRIRSNGTPEVVAGTGEENLVDGRAPDALLAQPSGVARMTSGIAFVDAESSALRVLTDDGHVTTLVGQGLFDWGASDGGPESSALQHPLGVATAGDTVYVADTFNSLLRSWSGTTTSAAQGVLRTLPAAGLNEPGGIDRLPDGRLVVADTNHHRVVIVNPDDAAVEPIVVDESWLGMAMGVPLSSVEGAPFFVSYNIDLLANELDASTGPPIHVEARAVPANLLGPGPRSWDVDDGMGQLEFTGGRPGRGLLVLDIAADVRDSAQSIVLRARTRHELSVSVRPAQPAVS